MNLFLKLLHKTMLINQNELTLQVMQTSHSQGGHKHGVSSSPSAEIGQAQNHLGQSLVPHLHNLFTAWTRLEKFCLADSHTWHSPVVWSHRGFVSGGLWSMYQSVLGNLSGSDWAYSSLRFLSTVSGLLVRLEIIPWETLVISVFIFSSHSSLKFS